MANYRVKRKKNGHIQVWARFTPFKGAATKSKLFSGPPEAISETALRAAEWVGKQRAGRQVEQD